MIHDLGASYPNAIGHDDQNAEAMPIEETGNLMILSYAYFKATGNNYFVNTYPKLFQSYADYLVQEGLDIKFQFATTDAAGPLANQTNLAIKAAVGLVAYGKMSGNTAYTDTGFRYAHTLYHDGKGTDAAKTHFTLEYGVDSSWTTAFNLFPDLLLDLQTFNRSAFDMQSAYYPTQRQAAGVPLDTRTDWGKTDWMFFAAGSSSPATQKMFVDDVWNYIAQGTGLNQVPFGDRYIVSNAKGGVPGSYLAIKNRPTVGAHFSLLAKNGPGSVTF